MAGRQYSCLPALVAQTKPTSLKFARFDHEQSHAASLKLKSSSLLSRWKALSSFSTSVSVTMFLTGLSQFFYGHGHPKVFSQSFGWR
jgi:hypothetical protein